MLGKRLLFIAATMASALLSQEAKQEPAAPASADVVFRSEVSLVRVDVQVLDRNHNAITGLTRDAFALREEGRPREIRNFASEDMPVDILLLLDVSGSMRPNLERVAQASRRALEALSRDDRVSVMVFDRATRVRLPFRSSREEVQKELDYLLDQERFNGGTDVRRALLDAARYVQRQARPAARRAIVIVTDDQTEFEPNDASVSRALTDADAVLSLLLAPAVMPRMTRGGQHPGGGYPGGGRGRYPGGGYPGGTTWPGGGGWPGGTTWPGGGTGWPGGGGTRIPGGGGNGPVVIGGDRTHSAGTDEIARESGGDSLSLSEASAFEMTLQRIRQRYALHFLMPDGVRAGEQRSVDIKLTSTASNRYPDAEVRFRRYYTVPSGVQPSTSPEVTQEHSAEPEQTPVTTSESAAPPAEPQPSKRRRVAVSEPATRGPRPTLGGTSSTQP